MFFLNKIIVENLGLKKEVSFFIKIKRRRIKMTFDLYDSEGSDSEFIDVVQISVIVEEIFKYK